MAMRDDIDIGDKIIYHQSNHAPMKCIIVIKEGAGCWCQLTSAAKDEFSTWLRDEPTLNNCFYVYYHMMRKVASFKQLRRIK